MGGQLFPKSPLPLFAKEGDPLLCKERNVNSDAFRAIIGFNIPRDPILIKKRYQCQTKEEKRRQ
jgi:hypothetical protein